MNQRPFWKENTFENVPRINMGFLTWEDFFFFFGIDVLHIKKHSHFADVHWFSAA